MAVFEFTSQRPKGNIVKLIKYSETNLKDLYNLAFGGKDMETGENEEDLNNEKVPVVRIDNSLEEFKDLDIFQEKVDKANEMLKNVGLPKEKRHHRQ